MVLALALTMSVCSAFAASSNPSITIDPQDPSSVENVAIDYVAYRILDADIKTDPVVADDGSTTTNGVVAYYVTTQDRVTELTETNLFNITQVGTENKWYVELKDTTTAEQLVAAFSATTFDLSKFENVEFSKAANADNATSGTVAAGYYYITSTLGSKMALQTLTAVSINEKNTYTTDEKTIPDADKNSEIGQTIEYTLTVNVPASANQQIVLTDTMSKGLKFVEIVSDSGNGTATSPVAVDESDAAKGTKFTITYTADQVKAIAASEKVITVVVKVLVTGEAAIDTGIPNTLDLKYGNVYDAQPSTVETKTTKATFDKEDNDGNQLPGAEFKLTKNTSNTKDSTEGWISLVEVEAGKTYRLATSDDTTTTNVIVTNGNRVTINGLDLDQDYFLVETKAPTGYNILDSHVALEKDTTSFIHKDVVNQAGAQLPSTGGIGTTIFYIAGIVMVLGAAAIVIARRKAEQ
jgi:fimbrial isopeptide formation D2 family protein/LPXTG-motif cell wall-anchored protein